MDDDLINLIVLVRPNSSGHPEKYIILFTDEQFGGAFSQLSRWAANPLFAFSWYDAAVLSQRLRRMKNDDKDAYTKTLPRKSKDDCGDDEDDKSFSTDRRGLH